MSRFAFRCDYCGIWHKFTVDGETLNIEQFSGIVMKISDDIEDVQLLNNSPKEEDETRDQKEASEFKQ